MVEGKAMKALTKEQKSIRFWSKVMYPEDQSYCWLWAGAVSKSGYGNYYNTGTHRFAYRDAKGAIPKGCVIMHSCDNKLCVNPNHLSIGTYKDNSIDMRNKKRNAVFKGESHGNSKLTEADVIYIKAIYKKGNRWNPGNADDLAARFNITKNYVSELCRGYKWKHLDQWIIDRTGNDKK
jgi:hypothetical protein